MKGSVEWPPCANGCGFEGVIFICSEGWFCEACYSDLAGVPIADAFELIDDPVARERLRKARVRDRTPELDSAPVPVENPVGSSA